MTAGGFVLPSADYSDDDEDGDVRLEMTELGEGQTRRRAVEWVGKPKVVGSEWMKMPLLTIGMLGLQCVWSIEMGYASPYLLELGLSKSLMSLVFVAGPLSGLIMQPLIGVLADRSKSPFGRRRPFMLVGCALSAFAIMLLGWSREVSHFFGGGQVLAIWFAVFAIYCIDFSINAVQATDRALVVDTLPPSQQEKGNAWAGRMFGTGSLAGFYVGNVDLVAILPFLGHTQLQVLSFLTSSILMFTHGLTAYSVKERILLRDNRKQSQSSTLGSIKEIWSNIFTLPQAIRSICFAQFFAWIGWFPILFFTSVWVGEIYIREAIANGADPNDPALLTDATRAGSRALFLNALVNLISSIFLPFLVHSSGIHSTTQTPPNTAAIKRTHEEQMNGRWGMFNSRSWVGRMLDSRPSWMTVQLPIPGFTLIRVWIMGQAVFAVAMFCTLFAHTVRSANVIIATCGFCWAVSQWAPFSLLGELILLDRNPSRGRHIPLATDIPVMRLQHSEADAIHGSRLSLALQEHEEEEALMKSVDLRIPRTTESAVVTRTHSRVPSLSAPISRNRSPLTSARSSEERVDSLRTSSARASVQHASPLGTSARHSLDVDPAEGRRSADSEQHHSKRSQSEESYRAISLDLNGNGLGHDNYKEESTPSPVHEDGGTAEKAGVILGIHNIFVVLPQFLVTFLSSIIFYLMEPTRPSLPDTHPGAVIPVTNQNGSLFGNATMEATYLMLRDPELHITSQTDSVGLVFRIGGICSAIAAYMCWRMSRDWARGVN